MNTYTDINLHYIAKIVIQPSEYNEPGKECNPYHLAKIRVFSEDGEIALELSLFGNKAIPLTLGKQ